MRVLLTGHKGYLGTVMAPVLAAAGHEVVGLDSGLFEPCVLGAAPADPPGHTVDLRDVTHEHVSDVDAVIHLAALSNDPLGALAPDLTYDINHRAAVRLARLARDNGVKRFLYASTCSVYGASGDGGLVTEDAPLRPVTPVRRVEGPRRGRPARAGRRRLHPGVPAQRHRVRLLAPAARRHRAEQPGRPRLPVRRGPGALRRHAVAAAGARRATSRRAFLAALTAPREAVHDQAFNIGTERNNVTVAEIAAEVVEAVPGSLLRITGEAGNDPRSYRVDFAKFREAIPGFDCVWSVKDGAGELIEAYQRHGLTTESFERRFTRLAWLRDRSAAGAVDDSLRRR